MNGFDVTWANPDQGAASPIAGAYYRITGPGGFDSGVRNVPGQRHRGDRRSRGPRRRRLHPCGLAPRRGRQHEDDRRRGVPLLFDDIPPAVAFRVHRDAGQPELIRAEVTDAHSGPAGGTIDYRRAGSGHWVDLPTALRGDGGGGSELVARFPSDRVAPGSYLLRAEAADAAGNTSTSTLRSDGPG